MGGFSFCGGRFRAGDGSAAGCEGLALDAEPKAANAAACAPRGRRCGEAAEGQSWGE